MEIIAGAVIPAAGSGSRLGAALPKQFITVRGVPILIRTIDSFLQNRAIRVVVVAVPAAHYELAKKTLAEHLSSDQLARTVLVNGGRTRQDSVKEGLNSLPPEINVVLVHDGARPFIGQELIDRCLRGAADTGAAITAIPVRDTLKKVSEDGLIVQTIDRHDLWQAQTPQAAQTQLLHRAYELAGQDGFQGTDEASLLEHAGIPVTVISGSEHNIKITRPDDLLLAERLTGEPGTMKIGHGFDAHRLVDGRRLILGGVPVPFARGLQGHSDADVVTHALIDALLGAMGEGDIGRHFPDTDPKFKDISSLTLLNRVAARIQSRQLVLGNADITVICQLPKLAAYIAQMEENLALSCSVAARSINIKATTTETMGFTGRGEGIAAHAVVLLHPARPISSTSNGPPV